ncbi:MAG: deoxyribonuclease IV [Lachnospiraceae bacterium]|nr:deoxyribonuclease IV [Lachnospiraceae bacterium]
MQLSIGIHQSFDGLRNALVEAESNGFTAFQMFIRNNRNMKSRTFLQHEFEEYNEKLSTSNILDCVVHAPYAMNPASGSNELRNRTIDMIHSDLNVLSKLDGRVHYVLHPGAYTDWDEDTGMSLLIDTLHKLQPYYRGVKIAVENMAGQGTTLISSLAQLGRLVSECKDIPEFEVCLDTCHLFGSGVTPEQAVGMLNVFNAIDRLGVIHVNDSKCAFASFKDRHTNLGCGYIGSVVFEQALLLHNFAPDAPVILETPEPGLLSDGYKLKEFLENK